MKIYLALVIDFFSSLILVTDSSSLILSIFVTTFVIDLVCTNFSDRQSVTNFSFFKLFFWHFFHIFFILYYCVMLVKILCLGGNVNLLYGVCYMWSGGTKLKEIKIWWISVEKFPFHLCNDSAWWFFWELCEDATHGYVMRENFILVPPCSI